MNNRGFYNEFDFINALNKKYINNLNKPFQDLLKKLYGKTLIIKLDKSSYTKFGTIILGG